MGVRKADTKMDWSALAAAVGRRREEKGLSQKQVAKESGVHPKRLWDLVSKRSVLGFDNYARLCAWLKVPITRFMLNHEGACYVEEPTPDKVEATLLRDHTLTREDAIAISEMFRAAYRALTMGA